jgi:hypothetical protein
MKKGWDPFESVVGAWHFHFDPASRKFLDGQLELSQKVRPLASSFIEPSQATSSFSDL